MPDRRKAAAVTRRRALAALLSTGAAACAPPAPKAPPYAGKVSFSHGVASGDPGPDRLIVWTRVSPDREGPVPVRWFVGHDAQLRRIAAQGVFTTDSNRDYTVKVDVAGLRPGKTYYYGFIAGEEKSPIGRAQTLPKGDVDKLVLAACSCSNYPSGFFNAYEVLAKRKDVQFVLHLGDYIYEYGLGHFGTENSVALGRAPLPSGECVSLADYRTRYAQYRTDPDLQAAHAAFAWICVWDDHEVCNDDWIAGGENHHPDEGPFNARRDAAIKAYYEWIPIREPEQGKSFFAINRSFQFGDLATLIMLETRLLARSQQLYSARDIKPISTTWDLTDPNAPVPLGPDAAMPANYRVVPTPFDVRGSKPVPVMDWKIAANMDSNAPPPGFALMPDVDEFKRRLADPARALLGEAQEKWLDQELQNSKSSGAVWQVLGNQVLMGKIGFPSRAAIGPQAVATLQQKYPAFLKTLEYAEAGAPVLTDSWDGYPAQRQRLFKIFDENDSNIIVLSGDSHQSWAIELYDDDGKTRVGDEFGVSSISSPGVGELIRGDGATDIARLLVQASKEVKWAEPFSHGFAVLTLNRNQAKAEFVLISTRMSKDYTSEVAATFTVLPLKGPEVGPLVKVKAA